MRKKPIAGRFLRRGRRHHGSTGMKPCLDAEHPMRRDYLPQTRAAHTEPGLAAAVALC